MIKNLFYIIYMKNTIIIKIFFFFLLTKHSLIFYLYFYRDKCVFALGKKTKENVEMIKNGVLNSGNDEK